jgi:hypothetical protein
MSNTVQTRDITTNDRRATGVTVYNLVVPACPTRSAAHSMRRESGHSTVGKTASSAVSESNESSLVSEPINQDERPSKSRKVWLLRTVTKQWLTSSCPSYHHSPLYRDEPFLALGSSSNPYISSSNDPDTAL